jgi:membrane associated rhomboid family serine protease
MEDGNVRRGELWRLVTSALPHGDLFHLMFNAYWIWAFGTLVEDVFGHVKTAALFVLLALGSGAAEYALLTGGIGLSGVGYGLFGMLWVLSRRDPRFAGSVDSNTTALFVVWFSACVVLTVTGIMPVGNVAHGVGALIGAAVGIAIAARGVRRISAAFATAVVVAGGLVGATVARPWVNLSNHGANGEFRLGYDALMADRNEEAARWLGEATRMEPGNATGWYDYGIALSRIGRAESAAAAYAKAYELDPGSDDYKQAYTQQKEYLHALGEK